MLRAMGGFLSLVAQATTLSTLQLAPKNVAVRGHCTTAQQQRSARDMSILVLKVVVMHNTQISRSSNGIQRAAHLLGEEVGTQWRGARRQVKGRGLERASQHLGKQANMVPGVGWG
ncbi:hypothetical protein BS17DRAFT_811562 [Gyrodon lividus]|nr:hypothetical protein BS17DRAFT_811562 [Gyrodon lividus]